MLVGIIQALVIMGLLIGFLIIDLRMTLLYTHQRVANDMDRNWYSYIIWSTMIGVLLVVQPIWWPWLGWYPQVWWGAIIQIVGLMLTVCALWLNVWSRYHLGVWYAQRGEVQPDHQLITSGPYALVRHPIFTAYFLFGMGLVLINPSIITILLTLYTFVSFTAHARRDEQLLLHYLPEYQEYITKTSRFFPSISTFLDKYKH